MDDVADTPWLIPDRAARIRALAARYDALQAAGQDAAAFAAALAAAPRAPARLDPACVERADAVLPGGGWRGRVPAGRMLRVANPAGAPGAPLMLWSAEDPSERMTVHDSMKVQWTTRLGRGRLLLSDMGRPLAGIADDDGGWHDALCGLAPPGPDDGARRLVRRSARETMTLGALKLGLGPRDLHACLTLFAPVETRDDQSFGWRADADLAGARVDLLAAVDLLVVLANAPHPLAPVGSLEGPLDVAIWRPDDDRFETFLRTATPEAARAWAGWAS